MSFRMARRRTIGGAALLLLVAAGGALAQNNTPMTPARLKESLSFGPSGPEALALADRVRAWIGEANLKGGKGAKTDGLDVAWAVEAPGVKTAPAVAASDGSFRMLTRRIGDTDLYAAAASLPSGTYMPWHFVLDGKNFGGGTVEVYPVHPDSLPNPAVPHGRVTQQPRWKSAIFPGTERDWWLYVPAQYTPDKPACVMVFQDGGSYLGFTPTILDNLIARGDMPVTVGIFVNPGTFTEGGRSDRSFEYDTLSDQYARFLLDEILPEAEKQVKLRHDASSRAVAGASSGGICAFTVAWQRPNEFSRVLSWIGSFTDIASGKTLIEGGHNYPPLIRKSEKKNLRVFLQDGDHDLDNVHGNWPLANQQMAKALAFKGYDYHFEFGHGTHSYTQGRAIMPDSLRWLWAGYQPGPAAK